MNTTGKLTTNNRWKNRTNLRETPYHQGELLIDVVTRNGYAPFEIAEMTAFINGEVVDDWHGHQLDVNDKVQVLILPKGGGNNGKTILSAVAAIAITVASAGAGAGVAAAGFGTVAASAAQAGVIIGGSLILGAIQRQFIKPPSQAVTEAEKDPFNDLSTTANTVDPFGVIPTVLGKIRMIPRVVAMPDVRTVGDHREIIQSFDFGFGQLKITEEKLGDSDLDKSMGDVDSFMLNYVQHTGMTQGDNLIINNRNIVPFASMSQTLEDRDDNFIVSTTTQTKEFTIEFSSGGLFRMDSRGRRQNQSVYFLFEVKKAGTSNWVNAMTDTTLLQSRWFIDTPSIAEAVATGNGNSARWTGSYYGSFRGGITFRALSEGQYDIRVTRLYDKTDDTNVADSFTWDYGQSVVSMSEPVISLMPDVEHTIVEMHVRGTKLLNGQLNNYSALVQSICWTYDGQVWRKEPTSNPAWLFLSVLISGANRGRIKNVYSTNALGQTVVDTDVINKYVNLEKLMEWAAWCDAPDPSYPSLKFECNMVNTSKTTVKALLDTICSAGLATQTLDDGRVSVVFEGEEKEPVHLVTNKNAWNISVNMTYNKPITGLRIRFQDESRDYEQDEFILNRDGSVGTSNLGGDVALGDYESLSMTGVTNYDQAVLMGKFYMAQERWRRERVTFTMDIENLVVQRGSVVTVSTDTLGSLSRSYRILQVAGNSLVVDEDVPTIGTPFIRRPDGKLEQARGASARLITVQQGSLYRAGETIILGDLVTTNTNYMVEDIKASQDFSATVVAVEYTNGSLYNSVISGSSIPDRAARLGYNSDGKIEAVNLRWRIEDNVNAERLKEHYVVLEWDALIAPVAGYQIENKETGEIFNTATTSWRSVPYIDRYMANDVSVNFVVTPISSTGKLGTPTTAMVRVYKDDTPPFDVTGFSSNIQDEHTHLTWDQVPQDSIYGYEIRWTPLMDQNANWANASLVVNTLSWDTVETTVPTRIGTYFIKAYDSSDNYSASATATVTDVVELEYTVPMDDIDPAALNWPDVGTSSNVGIESNSGNLELVQGTASNPIYEGYYEVAQDFEVGPNPEIVRIQADINMMIIVEAEQLDQPWFNPLANADPISPVSQRTPDISDAQIYYKISDTGNDWDTKQWKRLIAGQVKCRFIRTRVVLTSKDGNARPRVTSAVLHIDYLKRTEKQENLAVPSTGLDVDFGNAFAAVPAIGVNMENAAIGDQLSITNKSTTGFRVEIKDSAGDLKAGQIDYIAVGHGMVKP